MSGGAVRAVFFDLVGTLIHGRAPIGVQYAAMARRHGVDADADALDGAFRREMLETPPPAVFPGSLSRTAASERDWWRALVTRVVFACRLHSLAEGNRFDPFFEDLYRHFTTASAWQLYEDVVPVLLELRARGILTGLVTNYDTRVYLLLDSLGLTPLLDSVTIPAVAGAAKPDGRIFAHALGKHALSAREAVHVGDSPTDDYHGARRAGLVAVLLDRDGSLDAARFERCGKNLAEAIALILGERP
jgi:putative hydrolase of the HAD superfamily